METFGAASREQVVQNMRTSIRVETSSQIENSPKSLKRKSVDPVSIEEKRQRTEDVKAWFETILKS